MSLTTPPPSNAPPVSPTPTATQGDRPEGIKRVFLGNVSSTTEEGSDGGDKNVKPQQRHQQSYLPRSPSSDSGSEAGSFLGRPGAASSSSDSGASDDDDEDGKDAGGFAYAYSDNGDEGGSDGSTAEEEEDKTSDKNDGGSSNGSSSNSNSSSRSGSSSEGEGAQMLIEGLERILVATDADGRNLNVAQALLMVHDRLNDMTLQLNRLASQQQHQHQPRQQRNNSRASGQAVRMPNTAAAAAEANNSDSK